MKQKKKQPDHTSNNKVKLFCENIVLSEEEYFDDTSLTDGATYLTALIKISKYKFIQMMKFPRETKQRIQEIAINNGWNK